VLRVLAVALACGAAGWLSAAHGDVISGPLPDREHLRLPEGVDAVDRAIEQFGRGEYDQCLAKLQEAAAGSPDMPPARVMFAKLCFLQNQPARGRAALEAAAVEHAAFPETFILFGRLDLEEGRLTDAWCQFTRGSTLADSQSYAGRLKPTFQINSRAGMAAVAERRQDWPEAEAALTRWLELEPKNGPARQRLGVALFHQKKYAAAQEAVQQAGRDDPSLKPAGVVIGRLYFDAGDAKKAAEWMDYAVKAAPHDPRARRGYAAWLLDLNEGVRAKAEIEAAESLEPGSPETAHLRGVIAWHLKDFATAESVFQGLHLKSPGDLTVNNLWALALAEQPDGAKRARALQLAETNLRLAPNSAEALTTFGWICFHLGRLADAERSLRDALATGGASSDTAYYLARVLSESGRQQEVKTLLKASLDAPGRFAFRADAQTWLAKLDGPP
jgi:tetratricopeptide (TPR) repeat protein